MGEWIDDLSRALAAGRSRRWALRVLAGGAVTAALGLPGARAVTADDACKPAGKKCRKASQCCSGTCTAGACTGCSLAGAGCSGGAECCSGLCSSATHTCVAAATCTAPVQCTGFTISPCGPNASQGELCQCITTAEGTPACRVAGATCGTFGSCTTSADCLPGFVCQAGNEVYPCTGCAHTYQPLCPSA